MTRRQNDTPQQREITPGVGRWTWSDGTPLTQDEVDELDYTNAGNAGNFFDDVGHAVGFNPSTITGKAPGASLDTSYADGQRDRLGGQIAQLQQQAATGDGAWQQSFAQAVKQSQANAQSLGQSDASVDYGTALDNIGNAKAGAAQRAVGDEQILRAQSQLDARGQLGDILGQQGQLDIGQATESARVNRQRQLANQALIDKTGENREKTEKAITGAFSGGMGGMSEGGEVPGRARVFGNDERNDTVPAWLSPKEIVIPRDIAMSPDAPQKAAAFVQAVKNGYDPQGGVPHANYAGGGEANGIRKGSADELKDKGGYAGYFAGPQIGRTVQYNAMRGMNDDGAGGVINTDAFAQTADQQNQLASLFAGQAAGSGPSIVPAMSQRATDDNMGAAMAAQTRGGNPQADVLKAGVGAGGEAAADSGRQRAMEQSQGSRSFAKTVQQRRAQELQLASAQQQAGWEKTLQDVGMDLKSQAAIRGAISGAGQGATAFSGAGGRDQGDNLKSLSSNPYPEDTGYNNPAPGESESQWSNYEPEEQGSGLKGGMWAGGVVGMADGGLVARGPSGERLTTKAQDDEARRERRREDDEYEEETGMKRPAKRSTKPTEKESAFARAVRGVAEFAQKAGTRLSFAEGGGVPSDAGVDPYVSFPYAPPPMPPSVGEPQTIEPSWWDRNNPRALLRSARDASIEADSAKNAAASRAAAAGAPPRDIAASPLSPTAAAPGMMGGPPPPGNTAAQDALKSTPGLKTKAQHDAEQAAKVPPTGVKPAAGGSATSAPLTSQAERDALAETQRAIESNAEAERAANRAEVEGAAAKVSAVESAMNERKRVEGLARARSDEAATRWRQAQDEMNRIDTSVDPGRFWATRSTGDKVISIIGLVLGGIGAGPDGINRAAVMLNDAITRDLDAQKREGEMRMKKGGMKVESARTFYEMARTAGHDELEAADLAGAAMFKKAAAEAERLAAQTKDAGAKARAMMLSAAANQGAADKEVAAKDRRDARNIEWAKIEAARAKSGLPAAEQSKAIEVKERTGNIRRDIAQAKALIAKYGTMEKFGTAEVELKRLLGDIAQDSARLKDPNSTVKEQELINAKQAIGLEGGEFFTRNSVAQKLLDSYLATMEDREAEALRVRGLR